jgi:hypothetical protein
LRGKAEDAANVMANMIAMQNSPVDMLMYYDSNVMSAYCGIFDPVSGGVFKTYYSFLIFGQLYSLGMQVECISEHDGIYAIAAKGECGAAIALVNLCDEDHEISLSVGGIPYENASIFAVDKRHDFCEVKESLCNMQLCSKGIKFVKLGDF